MGFTEEIFGNEEVTGLPSWFVDRTNMIWEMFIKDYHKKAGFEPGPMHGIGIVRKGGVVECALLPGDWNKPIPMRVFDDVRYMLDRLTPQELMMNPEILDAASRFKLQRSF